jgi:hypothetical protein
MLDPSIPLWPSALAPRTIERARAHPVNIGPESVGGGAQSIVADAGLWRLEFLDIELARLPARRLIFRAITAAICAPLTPIYVPIFDYLMTPRYLANLAEPGSVTFSDGSVYSDGSALLDQAVDFTIAATANPRATMITIMPGSSLMLQGGQFIGLYERAHILKSIVPSASVAGGYDCQIWPYLRAAVAIGDPVWAEAPIVKCTVDPRKAETVERMAFERVGSVDMSFIETRWS